MFTRDVLRFYSPNISKRTQHTNVLLNGRGVGGDAGVYCTQYTVQWPLYTRTLRIDPDCDASPPSFSLSDSDDRYTPNTLSH